MILIHAQPHGGFYADAITEALTSDTLLDLLVQIGERPELRCQPVIVQTATNRRIFSSASDAARIMWVRRS